MNTRRRLHCWVLLVLLSLAAPLAADEPFSPIAGLARKSTPSGGLVVVDCNVFIGGKYSDSDQSRVTWRTSENFARLVAEDCPDASVIGMQEVIREESAIKMHGFLEKHTRRKWSYVFEAQGVNDRGSGLAVFFRPDRVELVDRLGTVRIERLDNGYNVRFMGALLKSKASGVVFGMFTGKLTWGGAILKGHKITEAERVVEARMLKSWIRKVMTGYPKAPRVIAMDMNSSHGSATFKELENEYEADGSRQHTHSSLNRVFGFSIMLKKLDYLWYDADSGPRRTGGFVSPLIRSEHFGSDHRAVWARLKL